MTFYCLIQGCVCVFIAWFMGVYVFYSLIQRGCMCFTCFLLLDSGVCMLFHCLIQGCVWCYFTAWFRGVYVLFFLFFYCVIQGCACFFIAWFRGVYASFFIAWFRGVYVFLFFYCFIQGGICGFYSGMCMFFYCLIQGCVCLIFFLLLDSGMWPFWPVEGFAIDIKREFRIDWKQCLCILRYPMQLTGCKNPVDF